MSTFNIILIMSVACAMGYPVGFKSVKDLQSVLAGGTTPSETLHLANTLIPSATKPAMFILPKDVHGWLSLGFYVIASVLSSGGVVCSGWCTIKFFRNGCRCKSAWFFPKSRAEYQRRNNIKTVQNVRAQLAAINPDYPIPSPTSSSPPSR